MNLSNLALLLMAFLLLIAQISGCGDSKTKHENYDSLSKKEINSIDTYVGKASVKDAIGQLLMVGIPADINTAENKTKVLDELIGNLGIGAVIVNGYNYYDDKKTDDKEYLTRVISFNNLLQRETRKSKSKLPLLIASDFEGPNRPTINRGLVLPPTALSLGATQDGSLIRAVGRYVGTELTSVGIQIILGPVLDTYNIKQGNKNLLLDRCFAATPEGVASTASHYIAGLNESGIVVFAKHYPSHGAIESSPEQKVIPIYEGSSEQLHEELKPFIQSRDNIRGIMTSHIQLANAKGKAMATFSRDVYDEFKKYSLDKKIIITDDMSEMGAIKTHMSTNNKTYQDIAIDAFDSGHDILLFSHLAEDAKQGKKFSKAHKDSSFTLNDLRLIQKRLIDHINSSEPAQKQFRESLRKVLILKAQVARMKSSEPLDRLLGGIEGNDTAFNFQVKDDGKAAIDHTEKSMSITKGNDTPPPTSNDSIEGIGNKLVKESIRKSAILINNKNQLDINLLSQPGDKIIIFAVYEDQKVKFETAFSSHFANVRFLGIPSKKDTDQFKKMELQINKAFDEADMLVYTARDSSDADLLERLRNKFRKSFSSKVIVFCHNSPTIFSNDVLGDATVIGNFSMHPLGFDVDIEELSGATQPRSLSNIPISIGDNGKFYAVNNTKWIEPANPVSFGALFPQRSILANKISLEEQYFLIPKPTKLELWKEYFGGFILLALISLISALIHLIPKAYLNHGGKENPTLKILATPKTGILVSLTTFILLFAIAFASSYVSSFMDNAADTSNKAHDIFNKWKN